jgi:hypothetical protein
LNILFTSRISSAALCPASCTNFPGFAQTNALAPQFYYWADSNIPDYQSRKRGEGAFYMIIKSPVDLSRVSV